MLCTPSLHYWQILQKHDIHRCTAPRYATHCDYLRAKMSECVQSTGHRWAWVHATNNFLSLALIEPQHKSPTCACQGAASLPNVTKIKKVMMPNAFFWTAGVHIVLHVRQSLGRYSVADDDVAQSIHSIVKYFVWDLLFVQRLRLFQE